MPEKELNNVIVKFDTKTTTEWAESTKIIAKSAIALEDMANGAFKAKIGDGEHTFAELPYFVGEGITQEQFDEALSKKVDAVEGMGLSENSFTTPEKNKLAGLENYDDSDLKADIAALESSKANKSEIPTSLPANGGNADAVGGYGAESLIQSNPNLLDNPDFKINQRGNVHYEKNSNTFYTVDRWRCQKGFSVDVLSSGGVEVTRINTSSTPISALLQIVPYNKIGNDIKPCIASIYVEEVSQNTGIYAQLVAYDNDLNVIVQSGALNLQPGLNVMTFRNGIIPFHNEA